MFKYNFKFLIVIKMYKYINLKCTTWKFNIHKCFKMFNCDRMYKHINLKCTT